MDLDDEQTLTDKIKNLLATDSQFRNPKFDPAPFLIQILKQKQSDHQAILQRQKQLIDLQNDAFDLIDQICAQYGDDFIKLLTIPQKQGEQLEKLKSNMSVVKKKVKETKTLLMATQKDIDQIHLNCLFNKLVYKKIKEIELKLFQYESASLALKNNEFLNCSMNLPTFQGNSVLQSALATKSQNLRLQLLSRGIQQVSLFLYMTPKIVLPTSQSLIQRVSSQESFFGSLKKHQGFHKRYNLYKKANCVQYLPTLWNFQQLQRKQGKIHLMYDIVQGVMNIGKIQEILQSLELDCKKSINSIFLLLQYFFSIDIEQESKNKQKIKLKEADSKNTWFINIKSNVHINFISVVMDVMGVIIRKLIILRLILKQFQIGAQQLSNLQCFNFFELVIKQLNQLVDDIYVKQEDHYFDFIHEQIMKKIKSKDNFIYWSNIRNILIKSLITLDSNISSIQNQYKLNKQTNIPKPKWEDIIKIDQFDKKFYSKFHISFVKTLEEIFNHQGRSFAFQSLQEISSSKIMNEKEINFCRYFSSEQIKYSKQFVFAISLFGALQVFFAQSNFNQTKCKKYQLFLLSILYLKLNYYIQRFFISSKSLQNAYEARKTNNKIKTKQKDFKRQFDKLYVKKKNQIVIKPWRRTTNQQVEPSKYRLVQNLKGIQKQNQMLLSYFTKNCRDIQKQLFYHFFRYKDSDNVITQISIFDKLEPTNYDQNFNAKLIRIWDQLPQIETSIFQLTLSLFQKFIQLHMVIVAVIFNESLTQ